MPQPENSVSQQLPGAIDTGDECFAVDSTPESVVSKKGIDAPADSKKEDIDTSGDGKDADGNERSEATDTGADKPGEDKEAEGEAEEPDDDKLPKGVKKKIDKITFHRREAERREAEAKAEADRLRAENDALRAAKFDDAGEKPKMSDFNDESDYYEALTDWKVKKALADDRARHAAAAAEEAKTRSQQAEAAKKREIQAAMRDAEKRYSDFKEAVYTDDLKISDPMIDIMSRLDNMGDVVYFLGKNRDKSLDICGMSIVEATIALKEISDTIKAKRKTATNSPDPIKPVNTSGNAIKDMGNMSMAEYRKMREAQDKARRGG